MGTSAIVGFSLQKSGGETEITDREAIMGAISIPRGRETWTRCCWLYWHSRDPCNGKEDGHGWGLWGHLRVENIQGVDGLFTLPLIFSSI